MSEPLVSIIIPTFNRAHLISETLDSVLAQSYTNWECLVVDDGSTDSTNEIMTTYCSKDSRFQYHHRPKDRLPGGNAARNYGFELSKGEYIQWFDDDDVMPSNALEARVIDLQSFEIDFVVSKSEYLNSKEEFYHYNFSAKDISFESFSMGNVSWVTDDFMVKRNIATKIQFNEKMLAGQEYNYCCKLLLFTEKAGFIDEFLTLRRDTKSSIGNNRKQSRDTYLKTRFEAYWYTFLDVSKDVSNEEFNRFSILTCISSYLRMSDRLQLPKGFYKNLFNVFGRKAVYFIFSKWSKSIFGSYYFFYSKLKS